MNYLFIMIMETIESANKENEIFTLTSIDKQELIENAGNIINHYINENILTIKHPTFHNELNEIVSNILRDELSLIYNEEIEEEIYLAIQKASKIYFTTVMPRRSYSKSFIRPLKNKEKIAKTIEKLRNVVQHEQRTKEWYEDRYNMISASSAWKALASQSSKNNLIYEKCSPLDMDKYNNINVDSPFHWGHKYEPLSIQIYEDEKKTKVEDFGCIPYDKFSNIGASPDGINTDPSSNLYGRMVEVKNRFSESVPITGIPKEEYWVQMQMQMGVCDLNECDFLETRFKEYSCYEDFEKDGSFVKTENGKMKGIYLYFQKDGVPFYEYPPLNLTQEEFNNWEEKTRSKMEADDYEWISNIYWYLDKISIVLVYRNKKWFNAAVKEINLVWDIIKKERVEGYEHRVANKRAKKEPIIKEPKCLLDISLLKVN